MKVVILLAGKGRRIQAECAGVHKALLPLNQKPLLYYLLKNIKKAGIDEIVPVLGYKGNEVLAFIEQNNFGMAVYPVWNEAYEETNNLVSLVRAKSVVDGQEFIQINGDMIFDYRILYDIVSVKGSAIAVDEKDYATQLDSPRVLIKNGRIMDLGRHMKIEDANGYAVGIYRFSADLARTFFETSEELIKSHPQLGFHEPLRSLFQQYTILPICIGDYLWMDVDEKEDIIKAETYLNMLRKDNE